jgi:hypothetical protein
MVLKSSFVGLLIAASLFGSVAMTQALAQQPVQSWERDLQKFYNRDRKVLQPRIPNPAQDALRKLRRDPLAKLGLPANQGALRQEAPEIVEPTFSPFTAGHDRDGDGAVTREEYFSSQRRHFAPGGGSASRRQRALSRLDSQFRNADIDRDGKVTAKELNSLPGARF